MSLSNVHWSEFIKKWPKLIVILRRLLQDIKTVCLIVSILRQTIQDINIMQNNLTINNHLGLDIKLSSLQTFS